MTNTTKRQAIQLVTDALLAGHVLQSPCARGHITAGPIREATSQRGRYGCYLYSRSDPAGSEIGWSVLAQDAALTFVEHVGRGPAGRVAREKLGVSR